MRCYELSLSLLRRYSLPIWWHGIETEKVSIIIIMPNCVCNNNFNIQLQNIYQVEFQVPQTSSRPHNFPDRTGETFRREFCSAGTPEVGSRGRCSRGTTSTLDICPALCRARDEQCPRPFVGFRTIQSKRIKLDMSKSYGGMVGKW